MSELPRGLRDFEVGESFTGFFVIRRKELRTKKDGGLYLALEFGDRTGRLSGNIWEEAERLYHDLSDGGVVKLQGVIENYRDSKQIVVKRLRPIHKDEVVVPEMFIACSPGEKDENFARLLALIGLLKNPDLKRLLDAFFTDELFAEAFAKAPGGKLWHHNRLGGLLEHTLSLARLARLLGRLYPELDKDLLLTGALLHDIGKVEEYRYETHIDYTDRGRLVGHIPLGSQWVAERAAKLENFPPALLDQVMHLVLSHQAEHGSPIQPATKEAFLLHYADQIDSKMDALRRISDEPGSGRWRYVRLLERYVDIGEGSSTGDDRDAQLTRRVGAELLSYRTG